MANTAKGIGPAQLGTSAAALYTCPTNTVAIITTVDCCNTDTAGHAVTLCVVRSGGTAGADKALFWQAPITNNLQYQGQQVLAAGDSLQGYADTGAVVTVLAALVEES